MVHVQKKTTVALFGCDAFVLDLVSLLLLLLFLRGLRNYRIK